MTRLFDYAAWVHRAQQFVRALEGRPGFTVISSDVSPPLTRMQLDALGRRLGRPLPSALRLFLKLGAAGMNCRYTFEHGDVERTDDALTHSSTASPSREIWKVAPASAR